MDKTEDKLWLTIFTKEDGSIRYGCRAIVRAAAKMSAAKMSMT